MDRSFSLVARRCYRAHFAADGGRLSETHLVYLAARQERQRVQLYEVLRKHVAREPLLQMLAKDTRFGHVPPRHYEGNDAGVAAIVLRNPRGGSGHLWMLP